MTDTGKAGNWFCGGEGDCNYGKEPKKQQQAILEFAFAAMLLLHAEQVAHGGKIDCTANAPAQQVHEQWHASERTKCQK